MPEPGGPWGPLAPPIFGRSVNPIPTGEGRLSPPITTGTPNIFHLPASLPNRPRILPLGTLPFITLKCLTKRIPSPSTSLADSTPLTWLGCSQNLRLRFLLKWVSIFRNPILSRFEGLINYYYFYFVKCGSQMCYCGAIYRLIKSGQNKKGQNIF